MKCIECGAEMVESPGTHDYRECGLPVRLVGVTLARCPGCGNDDVEIPRIEELHRLIARTIIHKPHGLSGGEARFLRKWLGHSSRDFAEIMGVQPETVSRWESGAKPMGATADRLLRVLVANDEPREEYPAEELRKVDRSTTEPLAHSLRMGDEGWRPAA